MAKEKTLPHNPMVTANALAATGAILYVVCALWVWFSRPTFMGMMGGWFHGVNLRAIPYAPMMGVNVVVGLVTFTVFSWLAGYLFATLYNWFAKKM